MKRLALAISSLFILSIIHGQVYDDYLGAGHADGVTVTTSSNYQAFGWTEIASGDATINGNGLEARLMETSRFLNQATNGFDKEILHQVASMDFEEWIDSQVDIPYVNQHELMYEIIDEALDVWVAGGNDSADYFFPGYQHFQYAWWQTNTTNSDLLRQRVSSALSEILVISLASNLESHVDGVADYQDMLISNAFGNYRDIMDQVTHHPSMGVYLSHYNNPLTIDSLNVHPDENYAREIMQLFSIGLYQLNTDGSYVLDGNNEPIPTYGINEIKELARVFTGLGPGEVIDNDFGINSPYFGMTRYLCDFLEPMVMYEPYHEGGSKVLLNGFTIPAGQTGVLDIDMALDHLFNHQNVGPFLARRLIQNMVKSNPSPGYIQRVALKFNDNGQGVRGDMLAVVKAILLDDEARTCGAIQDPLQGKLRSPLQRYSQFTRYVDKASVDDRYWNTGYDFLQNTEMAPYSSRSVFNFYLPDFQPNGPMADAGLFAPEYHIHNSRTSLGYLNHANQWAVAPVVMYSWEDVAPVFMDYDIYEDLARDPEVLINELDRVFTHGQMTEELRTNIKDAMNGIQIINAGPDYLQWRAKLAFYLVLISPDYVVLK